MTHKTPLCIGFSLSATWLPTPSEETYHANFYIDVAQQAETAKLDFVFKPDSLYLSIHANEHAPRQGSLDPMLLLSTLATHTQKIGLVGTLSTTFVPPYLIARQLQTLHWLSNGRAGWNIVTSLDGAQLFGDCDLPSADKRYAQAQEASELVLELWESFVPNGFNAIDYNGEFFRLNGVLNVPQHASGKPPLFQAGASDAGRNFASCFADAIFASTPTLDSAIELKQDLQKRAVAQGRNADAIRVLPGLYLFLGETKAQAQQLFEQTHATLSRQQRLTRLSSLMVKDCLSLTDETLISVDDLPDVNTPVRSRTHTQLLRQLLMKQPLSVSELLQRPEVIHSGHWLVIGTVDDAITEIKKWKASGAMDGFIALPGGSTASCQRFFNELMPTLRQQGLARQDYVGATLAEHLRLNQTL